MVAHTQVRIEFIYTVCPCHSPQLPIFVKRHIGPSFKIPGKFPFDFARSKAVAIYSVEGGDEQHGITSHNQARNAIVQIWKFQVFKLPIVAVKTKYIAMTVNPYFFFALK